MSAHMRPLMVWLEKSPLELTAVFMKVLIKTCAVFLPAFQRQPGVVLRAAQKKLCLRG